MIGLFLCEFIERSSISQTNKRHTPALGIPLKKDKKISSVFNCFLQVLHQWHAEQSVPQGTLVILRFMSYELVQYNSFC